ncbi:hypothetical protein [Inquilinus sp. CAU 1745]|uniref:hypothetical protein n=1 Tax=Inquilinus sp. CAU 1745 TaxID=3140369 RepID=UPI00325B8A60
MSELLLNFADKLYSNRRKYDDVSHSAFNISLIVAILSIVIMTDTVSLESSAEIYGSTVKFKEQYIYFLFCSVIAISQVFFVCSGCASSSINH